MTIQGINIAISRARKYTDYLVIQFYYNINYSTELYFQIFKHCQLQQSKCNMTGW